MGIKQYKPTSAGRRAGMVSDFADCTNPNENKPEKSLLRPKPKKGGRNNRGRTTAYWSSLTSTSGTSATA